MNVSGATRPADNLCGETEYDEVDEEPLQEMYYFSVCIIVDLPDGAVTKSGRVDLFRG
jgi:hypothetical protein